MLFIVATAANCFNAGMDKGATGSFQDRCEGRQPWPLCHVPDGRGTSVAADIPGNPVADRLGACTAHASMRRAGGRCDREPRRRYALIEPKLRVPAPRGRQSPAFARQGIRHGPTFVAALAQSSRELRLQTGTPGNVGQKPHNGAHWLRNAENLKSRCRALRRYRHI